MKTDYPLYGACGAALIFAVLAGWNYTQNLGLEGNVRSLESAAKLKEATAERDTGQFNLDQSKRDYKVLEVSGQSGAKAQSNAKSINDITREVSHAIPKPVYCDRTETNDAVNDARVRIRLHYAQLGGLPLGEED